MAIFRITIGALAFSGKCEEESHCLGTSSTDQKQQVKNILAMASWLARSILLWFPLPATAEDWEFPNVESEAAMVGHFQRIEKTWNF
jgi:hypothetical protein